MEHEQAEQTLSEVGRVRERTRRTLHTFWYSNLVAGLFFVGIALLALVTDDARILTAYWVLGAFAALTLIVRYFIRRERELGVVSSAFGVDEAIFAALIAGIFVVNAVVDGSAGAGAGIYPAAVGIAALGILHRDRAELAAGIAFALLATVVIAIDPTEPMALINGGVGAILIAAALAGRKAERSREPVIPARVARA